MQGQASHFHRHPTQRNPYALQRYIGETERLYGILNTHLSSHHSHPYTHRDYIVGPGPGVYSIADIANFAWVNVAYFAGVDLGKFPALEKWWRRMGERPAVRRGLGVPGVSRVGNEVYLRRLQEEPDFKAKEDELREFGEKAKEMYNYKYASP